MLLFSLEYCWVLTFLVLQKLDIGGCRCVEDKDYIVHAPPIVTAQVGLCVHIPCRFTVASNIKVEPFNKGLWKKEKPKEEVVASSDDPSRQMFFTGKITDKNCSFLINDVQKSDENSYYFRFEGSKLWSYKCTKPKLTVTDLTDKPEISVGTLVAGKEATATCRSPGVCAGKAPDFIWTGQAGNTSNYNNSYPNRTRIYFSNFKFTPSRNDNGKPLVCRVAFLSNTAVTEQTMKLNVEYLPDVIITTKGGVRDNTFIVKEGDSAQINCTVDSNPIAEITWKVENEEKEAIKGQWLIYNLANISLSDAGKYLCTGKNHLGSTNKTIDIIVHYAPRTPNINCVTTEDCSISEEHMVYVMEDSALALACITKSLPEASLSWILPDPNNTKYITVQGHLSFNKVALSDEGQLTCVASNIYGMSNSSIIIKVTPQPRNNTWIITAVSCAVVIVVLFIGGVLIVYFFRKKKLSKKSEDKKEMNADDSSVIYANSEVHICGNPTKETGTNSVYSEPEDNNSFGYMNVEDIHYATIDFSKLKPKNAPKYIDNEYE
ncbi:sialic acid-binding Ig-like lectin 13 isoform X1 [Phyllobates terribilis]|uniref:sialic acid-binding Ig-like lectin 13 isoform X1 n=1 Tax=Phyllobates terribilis TaxID=111132 RepID=UPI003CCAF9A9